jgi:hypothetical protein
LYGFLTGAIFFGFITIKKFHFRYLLNVFIFLLFRLTSNVTVKTYYKRTISLQIHTMPSFRTAGLTVYYSFVILVFIIFAWALHSQF